MRCKNLDIKKIKKLLELARAERKLNNETISNPILKKAAVLIPFVCVDGCWSLLFTKRADSLNSHKGQVSFPGGGMEFGDESPADTALRETYEEIGVKNSGIHVIGNMPDFITNSNYLVTPIVSWVDWPVPLDISSDEVSRVFTIPIKWLNNVKNWERRLYTHPNGLYGEIIFYDLYDGELLWGISAKITIELLNLLGEEVFS